MQNTTMVVEGGGVMVKKIKVLRKLHQIRGKTPLFGLYDGEGERNLKGCGWGRGGWLVD